MTRRRRGPSVRLQLASSYVGFLLVVWAALLLVGWLVLRYLPDENLVVANGGGFVPNRSDLLRVAAPMAVLGTVFVAVVGGVGGWMLAGRLLRPLAAIAEVADAVAHGSLAQRVALPGPDDELRRLADTVDHMLDRLEQVVEDQRLFAANASHELRTPIATTRTMLEVARLDPRPDVGTLLDRLWEVNERSARTVEALLGLARSGSAPLERRAVDLAELVREHPTSRPLGGHLDPAPVRGDPVLLGQFTANLLTNALVHGHVDGGGPWVRTGTERDRAVLEVENDGPVLDPAVVPTLVEPFARAAGRVRTDSRGAGIGLSIVDAVVRAHDGRLVLSPRDGGGLVVRVELPVEGAESA